MKNKNSLLIVLGNIVSQSGSSMFTLSLNWWIINTTNDIKLLGYISAASTIPLILLNLFGGVIADKSNKKKVLITCDILSGLLCIILGLLMVESQVNIPLVIIINFLLSTSMAIFSPTLRSIIPEIIDKTFIIKTNSILTNLSEIMKIVSPLIASALFVNQYIGIKGIFIINGISFILSAISEYFIDYTKQSAHHNTSILEDIKSGFKYIAENKILFKLLLICALVNFFIAGYKLALPYYIKNIIIHDSYYSFALAIEAIGGILGSAFVFKKKSDPNLKEISINLALCGVGLLLTVIKLPIMLLISVFFYGMFLTKFNITLFSYLQINIDEKFLGRVFSVVFFVAIILMPLGNLFFGVLTPYVKNYIFIIIGIGIISCVSLLLGNKKIFNFEKGVRYHE